jgi:hypothetical protein
MAAAERVRVTHEYDWNRRGRSLSRLGVDGARCHDDIDLEPDKFLRKFAHSLRFALRPSVLDGDGMSLHIAQLAKSLAKSFKGIQKRIWTVPQKTDPGDLPWLLRVRRRKRPRDSRAAKEREEIAASHNIFPENTFVQCLKPST